MSKQPASLRFSSAFLGVSLLASPAIAQTYNNPQTQQVASAAPIGRYGGGFFEFVMSGGRAAAYNQPAPAYYASPTPTEPRRTMDPMFMRQEVAYVGSERSGTIVNRHGA